MTHELFRHVNTDTTIDIKSKVHLVACHNDTRGGIPFLLFLLERDECNNLTYPFINGPVLNMKEQCIAAFSEFTNVEYVGYVLFNKEVYAFVHIIDVYISKNLTTTNKRWMCLVDEILNYGSVLDMRVNPVCRNFLFSNTDYYILYSGRTVYEIPQVAYITSNNPKQTEIDHHFGPTKCDYESYTFESRDELAHKRGIIRYAVFKTTPKTKDGKTCWFVKTLDNVVPLSWHIC